jgi:RNA polymerase sigma-70 factor, ECF subfamily
VVLAAWSGEVSRTEVAVADDDRRRPAAADRTDDEADDAELLRALHDEHAAALWNFVLHLTGGDRSRAEDVVQETLFRAWRRPAVLAQRESSARGWLFTVARNIVVDGWRSDRRRPTTSTESVPEPLEPDATDRALQSIVVAEAMRRLSHDHGAVLLECYYRGCTAAQAAARLGVPIGTVKSRLHYALHALRLVLEEMGVVT